MEPLEEKKGKKKIIISILSIITFIITVIIYSHYVGTTGLVIKEYKVTNTKLPNSFYGFKIAHISDLHYGRTIDKNRLKNVVDQINKLKPDIVVLTGDLLDNTVTLSDQDINDIVKELSRMNASIGKFAITGEHDSSQDSWSTIIKNSNFTNLNDTYELIYKEGYEPILLAGMSSNLVGKKNVREKITPINDYIESLKVSEELNIPHYKILLLHEPDFITEVIPNNYDLILAGHSHNGQVRLPFLGAIVKTNGAMNYYEEYYKLDHTDFYISSGLGTSQYDFRLFNRPSINFYRLVNK